MKRLIWKCKIFFGYFQNDIGSVTLKTISQYCDGEAELVVNGDSKSHVDVEQELLHTPGNYTVDSISAKSGKLVVVSKTRRFALNAS